MMTNGFGAYFGTVASSWMIDHYYKFPDGSTDWTGTWTFFAAYSLVVAILFWLLFKQNRQDTSTKDISTSHH